MHVISVTSVRVGKAKWCNSVHIVRVGKAKWCVQSVHTW